MRVGRLTTSVPELTYLPAPDRRAVWRRAFLHSHRHHRVWVAYLLVLAYCALLCCASPLLSKAVGARPVAAFVSSMLGLVLAFAVPYFLVPRLIVHAVLPHIRELMPGRCPSCGYDLRATPDRCPECGTVMMKGAQA